jgi:hypothetical protein
MTSEDAAKSPAAEQILRGGGSSALVGLVLGAGGAAVMIWGFATHPAPAYRAYLTAYVFLLTLVLGCFAFAMISHAANTTWPVAMRRLSEASIAALPLLAVLFVPLIFGASTLYPWAEPERFGKSVRAVLEHRRPFMNRASFSLRAEAYLVFWSILALLLRGWSFAMERGESAGRYSTRLRRLSYVGLPLGAVTVAFAGFDWLMSLAPELASTMFGAYFISMCLFGGAAAMVLLLALAERGGFALGVSSSHYHALGRLLLAFLIFVGYLSFFQYLLIWIGNKPSEVKWFLERWRGHAAWVSVFLVIGHFALPFLALLSFRLKQRAATLAPIAAWCLFSQYLHVHWIVVTGSSEPYFDWFDLIALIAVAALSWAFCVWLQRGKPMVAFADPRYGDSVRYRSR